MKTTMKMTKRFFSLLTAMVLCLAPMALMVGAAENVYSLTATYALCNHDPETQMSDPYGGTLESTTYLYLSYFCKDMKYSGGYIDCYECDKTYEIDGYNNLIAHPTFYQNQVNGRYYCVECGMEKAS